MRIWLVIVVECRLRAKGNLWHFGMTARKGLDANCGASCLVGLARAHVRTRATGRSRRPLQSPAGGA